MSNTFFLRRQPPDGPGIRCSNLDVFSYGQVTVTSRADTIALKDARERRSLPRRQAVRAYVVAKR